MAILEKIKTPGFWRNLIKVALPFFILVTVISLFMNSWRDIFAGDFAKVNEYNFSEGKWQRFWGIKLVISFIYGMYVTLKNTKK